MVKKDIINLINKYVSSNKDTMYVEDKVVLKEIGIDSRKIIIGIDKYQFLSYSNLSYDDYKPMYYNNVKNKVLLKLLAYCIKTSKNVENIKTKEEIIKEINNIIKEYGDFSSYDIDKYLAIDELKCGRVYVVTKTYEVDKVYCEILFCEDVLDEEYYDYYVLDIDVLEEILEYCNIYKQQCIEN